MWKIRLRLIQSQNESSQRVLSGRFGQGQGDEVTPSPRPELFSGGIGLEVRRVPARQTLLSQSVSFHQSKLLCLIDWIHVGFS